MPRSYSVGEFADELGVHAQTVKRWCRNDDLDYTRTPGRERRIPYRELRRLAGDTRPTDRVALYARVFSHGQKDNGDLDRQLDRLTDYAHDHGWSVENIYTDVGSGLNEDRCDLDSLLDDVQDADYGRVLVTYEDRLTRFGFSFLKRCFDCYSVTVTVIEDETDKSAQEELVDDLIKLVASVTGKLYGMRSSKNNRSSTPSNQR
ncbi:IS607 family transposase [Halorubrum sp. CBA1229]|nr:IS607 family transposase [Halorubrum sp. CBA1229]